MDFRGHLAVRDALGNVVSSRERSRLNPQPLIPSVVTRSDETGVWVTPVGGDSLSPLGPCTGGLAPSLVPGAGGTYTLGWERLPVGTKCLAANTSEGPFIVSP